MDFCDLRLTLKLDSLEPPQGAVVHLNECWLPSYFSDHQCPQNLLPSLTGGGG